MYEWWGFVHPANFADGVLYDGILSWLNFVLVGFSSSGVLSVGFCPVRFCPTLNIIPTHKPMFFNLFPHNDTFWHPWKTSLLKTLWEKEKLLVMSNFSFSHSVFYPFG